MVVAQLQAPRAGRVDFPARVCALSVRGRVASSYSRPFTSVPGAFETSYSMEANVTQAICACQNRVARLGAP
jgi:hypothetical protein